MSMMKIKIIGDEVLRERARDVTEFDDRLKTLADDMIETMHESDGIGLAAPQVGLSVRLLVTDVSPLESGIGPQVFVNPVILESQGECELEEGCLSIPGVRESGRTGVKNIPAGCHGCFSMRSIISTVCFL